jgi:hypothetical protein
MLGSAKYKEFLIVKIICDIICQIGNINNSIHVEENLNLFHIFDYIKKVILIIILISTQINFHLINKY